VLACARGNQGKLKTPSDSHCFFDTIVYRVVQCTLVHSYAGKSATACAGRELNSFSFKSVSRLVRKVYPGFTHCINIEFVWLREGVAVG